MSQNRLADRIGDVEGCTGRLRSEALRVMPLKQPDCRGSGMFPENHNFQHKEFVLEALGR
jgi:hypothetical protein